MDIILKKHSEFRTSKFVFIDFNFHFEFFALDIDCDIE
jgi:hypothetical protein